MLMKILVPDMWARAQLSWTKISLPCLRPTVLLLSSVTLVVIHLFHSAPPAILDDQKHHIVLLAFIFVQF